MSNTADIRVVVTGMGVASSLGCEVESFWQNVINGECGIDRVTSFDVSDFACQIAAEIKDFDPTPAFPNPKEVRRADRFTQLGIYAAWKALQDSSMNLDELDRDQIGCFIGSGIGGLGTQETQHSILTGRGPAKMSPFTIPMLILNMASGVFSIYNGLRGPNVATCSACATSTHALGEAWRTIKMGDAKAIFAGGAEAAVVPMGMGGFAAMKAMSTRNDDPKRASRPFDKDRDGFVMGEGAGVLVLEEMDHAIMRGAKIYCEIVGYGNTADANHLTAPDPDGKGAARCMQMALRSGGLDAHNIDYINAHGTSTPQGDICETKAVRSVFKEHADKLAVSSTKGATGHMLGAAGGVEMVLTAKALQTGILPPTINIENQDPECDLDYVA
ncbi:MAG TPA: beta-ketoacyl-[acyl-carrier-protein] synthase II, partial [Verrucomicrobiales bacterium]|nr:beta-ketoacyl-[acyl-carrier-protein] synthase II [Verrucomicrobiales bacterium]